MTRLKCFQCHIVPRSCLQVAKYILKWREITKIFLNFTPAHFQFFLFLCRTSRSSTGPMKSIQYGGQFFSTLYDQVKSSLKSFWQENLNSVLEVPCMNCRVALSKMYKLFHSQDRCFICIYMRPKVRLVKGKRDRRPFLEAFWTRLQIQL